MSLSPLDESAFRTSRAGVSRIHHSHRYAHQGSQQRHTCAEVPRRVRLPSDQSTRVFKCDASSRSQCHGHCFTGFSGQHLPLGTGFNAPVNATLLVHCTPVALSLEYGSQVWPSVAIGAGNTRPHSYVYTDKLFDWYLFGQRHLHAYPTVPFAVLPKDFSLLAERRVRVSQGAVDCPVFLGRDIQLSYALHHDPQVKTCGVPGSLYVGGVDQFSLQRSRLMTCFPGSSPISERTAIGPASKLAHALGRGASGLLTKRSCARCVMPRKESRQESERISFVGSREKFQFVTENSVHESNRNTNRPPCKVSFASVNGGKNGPLRLRLGGLPKPASTDHAGFGRWGGDYLGDEVAIFMAELNDEVAELFQYLQHRHTIRNFIGFECHVNEQEALAWLKEKDLYDKNSSHSPELE